jgi:plastocyanin
VRRHQLTEGASRNPRLFVALLAAVVVACSVAAGEGPDRTTVTITTAPGDRLAFEPAETAVARPGSVAVVFRNGSTLAHNLVFIEGATASTDTIVQPGSTDEVVVELPEPGSYGFVCTIHEGMAGTITVGSGSGAAALR